MYNYIFMGLKLKSDVDFLQLVTDDSSKEPDVCIYCSEMPDYILEKDDVSSFSIDMKESWLNNKTLRMRVTDGNTITYSLKPGGKPLYMRGFILGYGMAMLCLQRDLMALHCSAISIENKALLISGESGSGKSTLTDALLKKHPAFIADDMTVVRCAEDGIVYAEPAFPYQKLCRDAALSSGYDISELIYIDEDKDKFLVPCKDRFCYEKVPVYGLIVLYVHKGDSLVVRDLSGVDKFLLFAGNLFMRKLLLNRIYEPHIGKTCLEIASKIKVRTIGRPDGKDFVGAMADAVYEFMNEK